MTTLSDLRARYEAERQDAEHRAADAHDAAQRILTAAEAAGSDTSNLPADQAARVQTLIRQKREARADVGKAEAQLEHGPRGGRGAAVGPGRVVAGAPDRRWRARPGYRARSRGGRAAMGPRGGRAARDRGPGRGVRISSRGRGAHGAGVRP